MKILVTVPLVDPDVGPVAMKLLSEVGEVDVKPMTTEQLKEVIGDYDAVIVSVWHRVTRDVIDAGRKLKVIGTASVGVDHIDVEYAESRGIKVVSAAGASTYGVAECRLYINFITFINNSFVNNSRLVLILSRPSLIIAQDQRA
ncbi:MAG: hypothetical protein RXP99_01970 [Vulcanisaeta sp.]